MAAISRRLFLWWMGGLAGGAVVGVAEAAPKRRKPRAGAYVDAYTDSYGS